VTMPNPGGLGGLRQRDDHTATVTTTTTRLVRFPSP
jgi:hypothetical protein